MTTRSPLSRVLGSGSAKDGTDHWWAQRLSAVALALLGSWFALSLLQLNGYAYLDVIQWIGKPLNSVLLALLNMTLAYHSSLGIQVVIEDYVHAPALKVFALVLSKFIHIFVALAVVFAVLKIAFGAQV